jgi:hypothetical protein
MLLFTLSGISKRRQNDHADGLSSVGLFKGPDSGLQEDGTYEG